MSQLQSSFFKIDRRGAVVHLAMNRPDRSNAMSQDFWADLPRLMRELAGDGTVRCVVISGEGRNFSGGMDLQAFAGISKLFDSEPGRAAHAMRQMVLDLQDAFNAIEQAPFPVICAIHGACIGAGVDLMTACDLRIASKDAFFAVEEIHIGMAADVGTLQRLPKLIAPAVAAELAFTGRRFQQRKRTASGWFPPSTKHRRRFWQRHSSSPRSLQRSPRWRSPASSATCIMRATTRWPTALTISRHGTAACCGRQI